MQRMGMIRLHWVTEWQRRGVPHLHCAIWFPPGAHTRALIAWSELTAAYGSTSRGQHGREIEGAVGWFQYLSKHASRGVKHYQRSSANLPPAWQKKTGRMWGHWGDWPVRESIRLELEMDGFHALRRLVRSWRLADARASGDRYRIRSARSMLTSNSPEQSAVRGISEWIPEPLQDAFLANLATRGYTVTC
ncbi:putative replication protein [Pseudomonas amygdali pv. lachrymans]|uniref:Replication protein n=2 Tax=Pseudomonas amygdali TaxID=47877 RepID=A0ABR5L1D1_PSEAV|nr:putative replication protein [Pseudomonas amygdali pv. lachrymans]KPC22430.1 putative replication protein [Pseudomonas amygdali pv. lachrymans]